MGTPITANPPPVAIAPPAASARPQSVSVKASDESPQSGSSGDPGKSTGTEALQHAVDELNRHFSSTRTDLRFSVDKDLDRVVISVVDAQDGTVLRQIPGEEALRIARALQNSRIGNSSTLIEARA